MSATLTPDLSRTPIFDANGREIGESIVYRVPRQDGQNPGHAQTDANGHILYKPLKTKTVYFPTVYSDQEMVALSREIGFRTLEVNYDQIVDGARAFNTIVTVDGMKFQVYIKWDAASSQPYLDNVHLVSE